MRVTLDIDLEKFRNSLVGEYSLARVKEMSNEEVILRLTAMVADKIDIEYAISRQTISEIKADFAQANAAFKKCANGNFDENGRCRCASYPCQRVIDKKECEEEYNLIKE